MIGMCNEPEAELRPLSGSGARKWLALFLAVLGPLLFSSCVQRLHREIWRGAKVVDQAWWVNQPIDAELYRVGNAVYTPGIIGQGRGCLVKRDYVPLSPPTKSYCPVEGKTQPGFIRLDDASAAKVLQAVAAGERGEILCSISFCHSPESHLTRLPRGAKLLPVRAYSCVRCVDQPYMEERAEADAQKYWRYPLSAITALGVDLPAMIVGNAAVVAVAVITSPITVPIAVGEAIEQACYSPASSVPTNAEPTAKEHRTQKKRRE